MQKPDAQTTISDETPLKRWYRISFGGAGYASILAVSHSNAAETLRSELPWVAKYDFVIECEDEE
jgi:hypothetical protein